jgi:hypothetical protein
MPALTRRRDPEARQETWHVYYGDVRVGTIARSVGNPNAAPEWQWRCGFYPGSDPGECRAGTVPTFDQTPAPSSRQRGRSSRQDEPRPTIRLGVISGLGRRRSTAALTEASACPWTGVSVLDRAVLTLSRGEGFVVHYICRADLRHGSMVNQTLTTFA